MRALDENEGGVVRDQGPCMWLKVKVDGCFQRFLKSLVLDQVGLQCDDDLPEDDKP